MAIYVCYQVSFSQPYYLCWRVRQNSLYQKGWHYGHSGHRFWRPGTAQEFDHLPFIIFSNTRLRVLCWLRLPIQIGPTVLISFDASRKNFPPANKSERC